MWGIFHVIILTSLVAAANSDLNYTVTDDLDLSKKLTEQNQSMSRVQSGHISKRPGLVENLPLLNGLYVGILSAMATNAVLFYFQMWRPMVEEEEVEQRKSTEEVVEIVEEKEVVEEMAEMMKMEKIVEMEEEEVMAVAGMSMIMSSRRQR